MWWGVVVVVAVVVNPSIFSGGCSSWPRNAARAPQTSQSGCKSLRTKPLYLLATVNQDDDFRRNRAFA